MDISHVKTIYNFTYRMSGNIKVAEMLTEKVFSTHPGSHKDDVLLLKRTWKEFMRYYGYIEFKGEEPAQQALLVLPPELRCSVVLRDILGCPYSKIAAVLEKTEPETARLVSDGRQRMLRRTKHQNITG